MTEPSIAELVRAPELRVRAATISADLLENSLTGQPLTLEHRIELRFAPVAGLLRLGPFAFGARSWEQLAGLDWRPPPPEIDEVEGEPEIVGRFHGRFRLADGTLEVTCERLRFGALAGSRLPATIAFVIDEPVGRRVEVEAALDVGAIRVLGDIYTKPRPDLDHALVLARSRLDLDHLEPHVDDGVVVLEHV
jgi:hypothetical protein